MFIHSLIWISKTKICIVNMIVLFVFPREEETFLCAAFSVQVLLYLMLSISKGRLALLRTTCRFLLASICPAL